MLRDMQAVCLPHMELSNNWPVGCGKQGGLPNSPWQDLACTFGEGGSAGLRFVLALKLNFIDVSIQVKTDFVVFVLPQIGTI